MVVGAAKESTLPSKSEADDADVSSNVMYIVITAGMCVLNLDLDVIVSWILFPAPTLYEDDKKGLSDEKMGQGAWFDTSLS